MGPDLKYIAAALAYVFKGYNIDRKRMAVAGFSDGATYALSLGLEGGGLFGHIIAFSPGGFLHQPTVRSKGYISNVFETEVNLATSGVEMGGGGGCPAMA